MTDIPEHLGANPTFTDELRRLAGITGFASTVCRVADTRPRAFNRLDHVGRVSRTWPKLADSFGVDAHAGVVAEIIWLHDLNRWPFAHNLERQRYDQAADTARFLSVRGLLPDDRVLRGIGDLHAWHFETSDESALVALAADKAAGVVEDVLFSVCGLNLAPTFLGEDAMAFVGLDAEDRATHGRLVELHDLLHANTDVDVFVSSFDDFYLEIATSLALRMSSHHGDDAAGLRKTVRDFQRIRKAVIVPKLFPINNDGVSRRPMLQKQVFDPAFAAGDLGAEPESMLAHNDTSLATFCAALPALAAAGVTIDTFVPDLDFVSRAMPDRRFVRRHDTRQ